MLYSSLLGVHLSIAILTGAVIAYALYILARGNYSHYNALSVILGVVAGVEVLTGTMLALLSLDISALSLASHIAIYLGICGLVESVLFIQMRHESLEFSTTKALSPVFVTSLLFALSITIGV